MQHTPETSILNRPQVRGLFAAVVIAAVVGGVLALQSRRDDGSGESAANPTPASYPETVYTLCNDSVDAELTTTDPPVVGQPAPDFALCDTNGEFVTTLSGMKGKVVWLNFWATWCVPCKRELPDIQALYDEKKDAGLEVLIINNRESQEKALGFLPGLDIEMPVVIDRPGTIYDRYRLTGLPDSFFIDADGNIAALYYGFLTEEIARERLADAGLP